MTQLWTNMNYIPPTGRQRVPYARQVSKWMRNATNRTAKRARESKIDLGDIVAVENIVLYTPKNPETAQAIDAIAMQNYERIATVKEQYANSLLAKDLECMQRAYREWGKYRGLQLQ